jgi:TolA-binding protein
MDPDGKERSRLEGYLPKDEFRAFLEMSIARVSYMNKDLADAERRYAEVLERYPDSHFAPEALYYLGVSRYSSSHDSAILAETAQAFTKKYQDSIWALKSLPWLPAKEATA